jgi:hypothetical protein
MFNHILQLVPHSVTSTLSLNRARDTIQKLTSPLAQVASNIRDNQNRLAEYKKQLESTDVSIGELLQKQMFNIKTLKVVEIDYPKTVCTHVECKTVLNVGDETKTHYKTVCHSPCQLEGVPGNVIGHERLMGCACMANEVCIDDNCKHSYMLHMHIYYDSEEVDTSIEDKNVTKMLGEKKSDKARKEELLRSILSTVDVMNAELKTIRDASAKFACFLKRCAITPYNDAMVPYLKHLIKEHKDAGNDQRMRDLEAEMKAYMERIDILMRNMEEGDKMTAQNELPDIEQLFRDLRQLKHSGQYIRDALSNQTADYSQSANKVEVPVPSLLRKVINWGMANIFGKYQYNFFTNLFSQ